MKVLADTSALIAIAVPEDANHAAALAKRDLLAAERRLIFTSDAVLDETLNWFAIRKGARPAAEFGRKIMTASPNLRIIPLAPEDRLDALAVLEKFSQIRLSFVDASVIQLYAKLGFDRVFSFDRHFVQANVPIL